MKFIIIAVAFVLFVKFVGPFINRLWKILAPLALGVLFILMATPDDVKKQVEDFDHEDYVELRDEYHKEVKPVLKEAGKEISKGIEESKVWK